MFPPNSRYQSIPSTTLTTPAGKEIVYLLRRFVPSPDLFATIQMHVVVEGDRIDNVSAQSIGDPELYWRICDANRAMRPAELTERIGRALRITLPQGIPAAPNA
jgi:hypothetical protein